MRRGGGFGNWIGKPGAFAPGGGPPPFDPAKYTGTKSWYQADVGVTQSGGVVSAIADQGLVAGRDLASGSCGWSASSGPSSEATFTFDGTQRMTSAAPQGYTAGSAFSIVAVIKAVAASTQYGILGTGGFGFGGFTLATGAGKREAFFFGVAGYDDGDATSAWEVWSIVASAAIAGNQNVDFYVNGAHVGSTVVATAANTDAGGVTMLGGAAAATKFSGSFAEGGFLDHALSDADRAKFEAYLNAKYGIY